MTSNQLALMRNSEEARHNLAYETETAKHNRKSEGIALNELSEQTRHNKKTEKQARKELREQKRHSVRQEKTDIYNAKTNRKNAKTNRMNAKTNARNAQTNVYNARVNKQNADTNRMNAETNVFNANTQARSVEQQGAHYVRQDNVAFGKLGVDKSTLDWKAKEAKRGRKFTRAQDKKERALKKKLNKWDNQTKLAIAGAKNETDLTKAKIGFLSDMYGYGTDFASSLVGTAGRVAAKSGSK